MSKHPVLKGVYIRPDGKLSNWPNTRTEAVRYRTQMYGDGSVCPECGHEGVYCTHTEICRNCTRLKLSMIYWLANHTDDEPIDPFMAVPRNPVNWIESMRDMIDKARDGILPVNKMCKNGHIHYGTDDGKCEICVEHKGKKALALHHGLEWYDGGKCANCGHITLCGTGDDSCQVCGTGSSTATAKLMSENPDMVISKEDAQQFGFTVFRTGQPCKRGHNGWRWVANGACLECMKEKRGG